MNIRITVDVFSGRPNPHIELDDRQSAGVLDRRDDEPGLRPSRRSATGAVGAVRP